MPRGKAKAFEGGRVWCRKGPHSERATAMGENCQERAVQSVLRSPLPNLFVFEPDTYASECAKRGCLFAQTGKLRSLREPSTLFPSIGI